MLVNLYLNATTFDASKDMLKTIDNSDFFVEHTIVVPDKYSLQTEKLILSLMKRKALFNVRVMGITNLANEILKENKISDEVLTSGESLLLVQKAIKNIKDELISLKKNTISFCHEISKLISQFKSCLLKADDLNDKASGLTGEKYHDLKLIFNEYERLREKLDENSRLQLAGELLKDTESIKNTKFYFSQFDAFTQEAYQFIKQIIANAKETNFAIAKSIDIGNEYIYEKDIFNKISSISQELGIKVNVVETKTEFPKQKEAMLKGILSYNKVICENKGFYNLFSASNLTEEVLSVAKIIYNFTGEYNYGDIAVLVSDLNKYKYLIEDAFNRFDIPYYIDESVTADKTILVNLIYSFFEVVESGYSIGSLINLFSNILIGKREELIQRVEFYEIDSKYKYKKFIAADFEFDFIFEKLEGCKTAFDFSQTIKSILDIFADKWNEFLSVLEDKKYLKEKNINVQIIDVINENLELINKFDEDISLSQYKKKLDLLLSFKTLSTVPTFVDGVFVGDATTSGVLEEKVVIIMGANDLPITSQDNGFLSDDELKLNYQNKIIEPSIRMVNRRNRYKIFELLCKAKEKLILTYQVINDEGKKNEVPNFVNSLNEIFSVKANKCSNFFDLKNGVFACGNRKNFITENYFKLSKKDRKLLKIDEIFNKKADKNTLNYDKNKLYFADEKVRVTQIEQYFSCPFKHFLNYGLKLKEKEKVKIEVKDIGNICHRGVELFVKQIIDTNYNLDIDIEKFIDKNYDRILKDEKLDEKIKFVNEKNSLDRYIKNQLKTIFKDVKRELEISEFRPKYIEMKFDNLFIGNKNKVKLIGKADRIDVKDEYFRIIDYKTGNTGKLLEELYYGNKLQLFLYQKEASEVLKKKRGGVFYFDAKYDFSKVDDDKKLLKGIAPNDEKVIQLLDKNIDVKGKSEILSISLAGKNNDNKYKGSSITDKDLTVYENYAIKIASKALDEITDGFIQPKPDEDACNYCPYKSICLHEKIDGERKKGNIGDFESEE